MIIKYEQNCKLIRDFFPNLNDYDSILVDFFLENFLFVFFDRSNRCIQINAIFLTKKTDEDEFLTNLIDYLVNSFDSLIVQFRSSWIWSSHCVHIKIFDFNKTFSICNNKSISICVWSWMFSTVQWGELLNSRSMIIWYIDTYSFNAKNIFRKKERQKRCDYL